MPTRLRELPREAQSRQVPIPPTVPPPRYPEDGCLKTLVRSLSMLDEWLEENEGRAEDEVRIRRVRRWRREALEQLRLRLNLTRP
jgi:hypothetical protein